MRCRRPGWPSFRAAHVRKPDSALADGAGCLWDASRGYSRYGMPQTSSAAARSDESGDADRRPLGDLQPTPELGVDVEQQLRSIQSLTHASLASLDLDEFLVFLLDRVLELLRCDTAAVLLLDA